MKLRIIFFFIFFIGFGTSLKSEVPKQVNKRIERDIYGELRKKRLETPAVDTYLGYLKEQLLKMKTMSDEEIEEAGTEEFWLKRISKIHPKHMPYYAPSLFTNSIVPKSVLERPEIKKYEGKLPEIIAPEVKDVVEKYGKDIPPDLYYLLMPETYHQFRKPDKKEVEDKAEVIKISRQIEVKKENAEKIFQSSGMSSFMKETMALIDANMDFIEGKISKERNKKIDDKTKLTNQDVLDFIATIPDIRMVVENKDAILLMIKAKAVKDVKERDGGICTSFIDKTKQAGLFDRVIAEINKNSFDEASWLNICARVFNASRYTRLDLDKADTIYYQSVFASILKKKAPKYDGSIDDYMALYPYRSLFYRAFTRDMFIVGENK